jgi:pyridoxine 5-phosphate synthase
VNAGHGLGYDTIKAFKGLGEIDEFSIGHSIIARAVMVGLEKAVRDMAALIKAL